MFLTCLTVLGAFLGSVSAAPAPNGHVLHERREESTSWIKLDKVPGRAVLPMRIGLAQSALDRGHEMLMEVCVSDAKTPPSPDDL